LSHSDPVALVFAALLITGIFGLVLALERRDRNRALGRGEASVSEGRRRLLFSKEAILGAATTSNSNVALTFYGL
jgi:hypothetical protein